MVEQLWSGYVRRCGELGLVPTRTAILVSISAQRHYLFRDGACAREDVASTGRQPPSCLRDSLGTPTGLHRIAERIGDGQPLGMVFKSRVPTGKLWNNCADDGNLITTRILWLDGLEPGHNQGGDVDTKARYVYIHGTNRESALGTPQSAGCVLLANAVMREVFDAVSVGDLVWIA
jgi:hypothetical protein